MEALDGFGLAGFDLMKEEGGKCFFLYASWTPSSSCDLPSACLQDQRLLCEKGTNSESPAIVLEAVSQLAVRLLLDRSLIVLQR